MGKITVTKCPIEGLYVIEPTVFGDERGYFSETYNLQDMAAAGLDMTFVQDNQSGSSKGVLRGLHYQIEHPQGKLVRVIKGRVFDVAVDIRKGSKTFGQWYGVELSAENHKQFYIDKGFAHGFLVLSDMAEFCYKCTDFYHPGDEGGLAWNDPAIGITWPEVSGEYAGSASAKGYTMADGTPLILSEKDQKWGCLADTIHHAGAADAANDANAVDAESEADAEDSESVNPYRAQIEAYLEAHLDEMIEDAGKLIRIDSQKGEAKEGKPFGEGPAAALAEAETLMKSYGLKVTNYDNYCVTGDLGEQEKELDILAHLDVVPVSDEWTVTKPFEPKVVDGRLYGRGSIDDKGPAMAALYAMRAVKDLNIPLASSLRIILGSDEECGSSDIRYYYAREKEAPFTFTPDADFPLINLEKGRLAKHFYASLGDGSLTKGDAGSIRLISLEGGDKVNVVPQNANAVLAGISKEALEQAAQKTAEATGTIIHVDDTPNPGELHVHVRGTSAHGSLPEKGNNAVTALLALLTDLSGAGETAAAGIIRALNCLFAHGDTQGKAFGIAMADDKSGALSMNLGVLKVEEDQLTGEFDVRAPICANDSNLTDVMRAKFEEAGLTMEEGLMKQPHYVPETLPQIKTLLSSYEHYTGRKGECLSTGGGTYVHDLKNGVAFGCELAGIDNHMHGDDEFIDIDVMLMSAKIFADVIVRICGKKR